MKIKDISTRGSKLQDISNIEDKNHTLPDTKCFKKHLDNFNKAAYQESLTILAADINRQGEVICKCFDIKELKKYKKLISAFLQEAVKHSYELDRQGKFDGAGSYKIFAKVKKINKSIETLTNEILKEQADPIEVIKRVEEIKGLILDIML
jgi:uncharacterized protein YaaR (DUF327 family)